MYDEYMEYQVLVQYKIEIQVGAKTRVIFKNTPMEAFKKITKIEFLTKL